MEKTKFKYFFMGLVFLLAIATSLSGISANGWDNTENSAENPTNSNQNNGNLSQNITNPNQNNGNLIQNITSTNQSTNNSSTSQVVKKPTRVSQNSVINAAKVVNRFVSKKKVLPDSVLVSGYRFSMAEFLYLMSKTINHKKIKSNALIKVKYDIKNPKNATGTGSKGKIYSYYYTRYADSIIKSIDKNKRAPNFIVTAGGNKLQYQSIIFVFAKALSSTKKNLPYFVSVLIKKSTPFNTYMPTYHRNARFTSKIIGQDERGRVHLIETFGDSTSKVKIAFIIGIHPLENNAHKSLYNNLIAKVKNLQYKYYIYKINVTQGANDYDIGRRNGELLANKYVLPNVRKNKYDLVVDIHANRGTQGGNYEKTNFIFAPLNKKDSRTIANTLIKRIPGLSYYFPESQTSPHYITNPLVQEGTKTIIYETYLFETKATTDSYMKQLIDNVDALKL